MTFMSEFNAKGDILVEFLKKKADDKTEITLIDFFNRKALDIIASVSLVLCIQFIFINFLKYKKAAFSMKIDSVNDPENKFNEHIFHIISNWRKFFFDPLIKFKHHKWGFLIKYNQSVRYFLDTGRKQLVKRLEMIKNNQELPNDILTTILKSHGKLERFVAPMFLLKNFLFFKKTQNLI
jgi:hypothetical protein